MAAPLALHVAGRNYTIAADDNLPKGKRAYQRTLRPSQASDPGVPKTAVWRFGGPYGVIGRSREGEDGVLATDYAEDLDTRFDALLTSGPALNSLSLTPLDALSSAAAALGALRLGARALGGGSSASTPRTVSHFDEDRAYLFAHRGAFSTQVNPTPATWTVIATKTHQATVKGAVPWYGMGRLGMGSAQVAQKRTVVTSTGATYADQQVGGVDIYTKEMVPGNDRLWMVQADTAGTSENRLRYTADDFASALLAGFVVGDPRIDATALGTLGGNTLAGSRNGAYSFTDRGTPVNVLPALKGALSSENGRKWAEQWGWAYVITVLGLYAIRHNVANPVGVGSDAMYEFEGFDGRPTAVYPWREGLVIAYQSSDGTTRMVRGVFNEQTGETGHFDCYPIRNRGAVTVNAIGATYVPTNPHVYWGEDANTLIYMKQGRGGGRDLLDSNYRYAAPGGGAFWYGSTMMRNQHLRKTVRYARFFCENMNAGNSWTLAVSMDEGAYAGVGSAVTANGSAKVVPSVPTSAPTGHTIKPRLTQVSGAATAQTLPPQLRGTLEVCYDERPDMIWQIDLPLVVNAVELARLQALADGESSTGKQPSEIRIPNDPALYYGYVAALGPVADIEGDSIPAGTVRLIFWDTS